VALLSAPSFTRDTLPLHTWLQSQTLHVSHVTTDPIHCTLLTLAGPHGTPACALPPEQCCSLVSSLVTVSVALSSAPVFCFALLQGHMASLRALYLQSNDLGSVTGLATCTQLVTLNISSNPLNRLLPGAFPPSLLTLHASGTGV
jgi:Leucine-rich repeat (LRR) protein